MTPRRRVGAAVAVLILLFAGALAWLATRPGTSDSGLVLVDKTTGRPVEDSTANSLIAGIPDGLLAGGATKRTTQSGWSAAPVGQQRVAGGNQVLVVVAHSVPGRLTLWLPYAAAVAGLLAGLVGAAAWSTGSPTGPVRRLPSAELPTYSPAPAAWAPASPPPPAAPPPFAKPPSAPQPPPNQRQLGPPAESPGVEAMVRRVIEVRDLVSSQSLSDRLGAALEDVGIQTVDPIGQAFDPAAQHAVDVAPTTDPSAVGRVAATERVGYLRQGVVLRVPEVVVYKAEQ